MPRGGARPRSGPAANPQALRADRADHKSNNLETLPAEGRKGAVPDWPFPAATTRELDVWRGYWQKPQAIIWERDRIVEYVALFVRQFVEAEKPHSSAENRKTVRMMMADLYLTPDSLFKAGYRIGEVAPQAEVRAFRQSATSSHLSVVVPPSADDSA